MIDESTATAESKWEDSLPHVRLEMHPRSYLNRVYINGEEWRASVKGVSFDIDKDHNTIVTLRFYARVTAEGPLALRPWPIEVENQP